MGQRQAAADETRDRILAAARKLLLAKSFSQFHYWKRWARAADVSQRLTVYYQFNSKAGCSRHSTTTSRSAERWSSWRTCSARVAIRYRFFTTSFCFRKVLGFGIARWIRRLHALGAIDAEIGKGLRARNERRRRGLLVIVERYGKVHSPLTSLQLPVASRHAAHADQFRTFDALSDTGRSIEDVVEIIRNMAHHAIGFTPRLVRPLDLPCVGKRCRSAVTREASAFVEIISRGENSRRDRQPERDEQKRNRDRTFGPGVQSPLSSPGQLQRRGEGLQVRYGPLITVRPAREPIKSSNRCK